MITHTSGVVSVFGDYGDDEADLYARFDEERGHSPRRIRLMDVPGQGTRATHQVSGRTA
ncbi:hypothetical protein [Tautonia plasticadhaerens]|uniref:hypothetical protein n=1 Tax=Tautonia plasticadhaerens TaxID=2527974 RepID=UPI0018D25CAD|nr:hypothetical protein [Tautonia plasticadhaerens]